MDDQDLNALLDGDSSEATAEVPTGGADDAAETSAMDVTAEGGEAADDVPAGDAAADMAADMMGESNSSSDAAADIAADMMSETSGAETAVEESDTTASTEVEASGKTSENQPDDSARTAKPAAKTPATLDERLKQELGFANLYLRDCESLILYRVFNKVHIAYYQAWIRDARGAMALISSLRRRRQRLERNKAENNSQKKDTESAA